MKFLRKRIHGKEVLHDRVKPLQRLFGQGGGGGLHSFCIGCPPPLAWLASVVVRPYHVAQKLEHLFIKDNNNTNILTVKFSLHFTQKYYAVIECFEVKFFGIPALGPHSCYNVK